jgi:hypothetical protein
MTKLQMTKPKTNAHETREKHERLDGRLRPIFVWNFENLNFDIVSDFEFRASNLFISGR